MSFLQYRFGSSRGPGGAIPWRTYMLQATSASGGATPWTPALDSAKIDNPASYSVAIYHFNAEIFSRNNSKSAMTAAAYRARNKV